MLVFVINLERAPERRETIGRRLKELGVAFEFFPATDGRTFTDAERALVDNHRRHYYSRYPLADNALACGLSHRRAMQEMLKRRLPMAAVIEDDAILTDEFPEVLKAIELEIDFDFIFLHTPLKRGKKRPFVEMKRLTYKNTLGRVKYMSMRTTGYVVSKRGAETCLKQTGRFVHAIDAAMHRYWENGMTILALQNPVVLHDDEAPSCITATAPAHPTHDAPYPDADTLYWKCARGFMRALASIQKRIAFHTR